MSTKNPQSKYVPQLLAAHSPSANELASQLLDHNQSGIDVVTEDDLIA
jgi:hypothetical protein